jgi:hypothetical protein
MRAFEIENKNDPFSSLIQLANLISIIDIDFEKCSLFILDIA